MLPLVIVLRSRYTVLRAPLSYLFYLLFSVACNLKVEWVFCTSVVINTMVGDERGEFLFFVFLISFCLHLFRGRIYFIGCDVHISIVGMVHVSSPNFRILKTRNYSIERVTTILGLLFDLTFDIIEYFIDTEFIASVNNSRYLIIYYSLVNRFPMSKLSLGSRLEHYLYEHYLSRGLMYFDYVYLYKLDG